ncbi:POTRA domain-containing protein, partial [Cupriavidus sp. 2SB]|uniref:POTRA domain-containing protein n=1 Tax=Cupriavidus sp. 2SB TaxID=2502199 RepID=UPI0010F46CB2
MAQVVPPSGQAALTNAEQDQRNRQQQEARERAAVVNAPAVRAEAIARAEYPPLPTETPCFHVDRFALEVPQDLPADLQSAGASALPMDPFAFARQWLEHYQGQCVGKQGVETLVKGLSQTILSKGYVTTRVLVPEQDLSSGKLKLALIPGVIGAIRFSDPDLWGTWKTAFPTAPGELLN